MGDGIVTIAVLPETMHPYSQSKFGICMEGRWKGWLFRQHPDGGWVSVQKLERERPPNILGEQ